jgi:hypothetical protein
MHSGVAAMGLRCLKCGNEAFQEAVLCPYCGARIKGGPLRRPVFPTVAGVLEIIAATFSLLIGLDGIVASQYIAQYSPAEEFALRLLGVFGITGFALGLTSAVFTLMRKHFGTAIGGMLLTILSGSFCIFAFSIIPGFGLGNGVIAGAPTILLALLSLTFTATSEEEKQREKP